jgi:hypothetical protein
MRLAAQGLLTARSGQLRGLVLYKPDVAANQTRLGEGIRTLGRREPTTLSKRPVLSTHARGNPLPQCTNSAPAKQKLFRLTNGPRVTHVTVPKVCHLPSQ